ncbi:MAG: DNA polymerase, partial [Candidatus Omnitrophota bacterium]
AGLIFGVEESLVSDEMRETAKRINFGIVYGMGSFGLAKDLEIPVNVAQDFIDNYFLRYPKVNKFIASQIALAKDTGFVTTILGRRRHLPEINNKNSSLRSFAERQAVNSPIQGSAADLIKLAMINIHQALFGMKLKAKLIMQIHDELVFEVPEAELEAVSGLVRDKMENVHKLDVPVKVNIKKGKNWQEMELVK